MPPKQHPRPDELTAFVTNRLLPPTSVRVAQHVLECPDCMTHAAALEELMALENVHASVHPLTRWSDSAFQKWCEPSSGLASALAAVLLISLGLSNSLVPTTRAFDDQILTAGISRPNFGPVPDMTLASTEPEMTEPETVIRKVSVRTRNHRNQRRTIRHFIAPDGDRAYQVGYLLPPPSVPVRLNGGAIQLARLSTEVGEPPAWPVKQKRHPILRFFGAIAKPFRSDRT
jgi:hypothetical protein